VIEGTITAKPQVFAAAVKWAAKFLDAKPTVPIQGGLLIDVGDGAMAITAYNETVTARAVVPVDGDGSGATVVSGRLLDALVGTFPAKPVELRQDDKDTLVINAARWTGTLPTFDADDFPPLPDKLPTLGRAPGDRLASAIHRAAAARSVNPKQPLALHLMHLTFGEDEVTAMATNSFRAARDIAPFEWLADDDGHPDGWVGSTALVMAQTMVDVAEAFTGPDEVEIGLDAGSISLASPTRAITLRQVADPYPMLEAVRGFFRHQHPEHVVVKVGDLAGPLKRAGIVRDKEGPVRIAFSEDLITINAKAETLKQDGAEEVDAQYSGPEVTLAFNPRFFADALASAPGDEVDIAMRTDVVTGVVVTVPGNESWRHVLMPLKG
jgi:DNA polymerase III subunit beta